jgi:LysM domain
MAIPDKMNPDGAVRVEPGDTLSAIAKANGLSLAEIRALNPALMSNPKYDNGNTIFSNTKINIAPPAAAIPVSSGGGITDSQNAARLAAEEAARNAATKTAADAAAKAAADAAAKAAADAATKAAADAATKAAQDAATKAAADAATKAAQDAATKAAADATAAANAAAKIEADRLAALQAIKDAKTAAELAAAQAALAAAQADAQAAADAANAGNGVTVTNNTSTPASTSTYVAPTGINSAGNMTLAATNAADTSAADYAKAQAALEKFNARESTIAVMQARFKQYNLGTLADKIRALAVDGATEATITLQLAETPEYQARFKANATRLKNNLQVLTPAEYLNVEDGYRQVLRAYGLTQFANDDYVTKFIENDVSATELTNRISTAVTRIQNADPSVTTTLRDYYGITAPDLVGFILDPAQNIDAIQKKISGAEIGAAARAQGLNQGMSPEELAAYKASADTLVGQGVTQQQAQTGYATIAGILPTAEKLSEIYGNTTDAYGQTQAEQEVFGNLASAQRARAKLTAKEIANFSGSAGTTKGAFSTGYLNKQSSAGQY